VPQKGGEKNKPSYQRIGKIMINHHDFFRIFRQTHVASEISIALVYLETRDDQDTGIISYPSKLPNLAGFLPACKCLGWPGSSPNFAGKGGTMMGRNVLGLSH
jgi:hypothetical protein